MENEENYNSNESYESEEEDEETNEETVTKYREEINILEKKILAQKKILELEENIDKEKENEKTKKESKLFALSEELENIPDEEIEKDKNINKNNLSLYPVLNLVNDININLKLKTELKNFEINTNSNISDSEKFKLLKHLGNLFNSFSDIFIINNVTFNRYQQEVVKINNELESNKNNLDSQLNTVISINIFCRPTQQNFIEQELHYKEISLDGLEGIKFSFIEYDEKLQIVKKFTIGEIKLIACRNFNVESEDYLFVNKDFKWWPYNLILYDEIFSKNVEGGFIESTCKFFQMNPFVTDSYCLILVHKKSIKNSIIKEIGVFAFINDDQTAITGEIKKKIQNSIDNLQLEDKINESLKKINPNANLTIDDLLKDNIHTLIKDLYDYNLIKKNEVFIMKNDENSERDELIKNEINDFQSIVPSKKISKKRPKNFKVIELQVLNNENINNIEKNQNTSLIVNPEIKQKILHDNKDILFEFEDNPDIFVDFCEGILYDSSDSNKYHYESHKKKVERNSSKESLDNLITIILDYIKDHGTLYYDQKFYENFKEKKKITIIDSIVEDYIQCESNYVEKIKNSSMNLVKKKGINDEEIIEKDANLMKKKTRNKFEIFLRLLEFFFICVMIILYYNNANKTENAQIEKFSNFNQKINNVFDEKSLCNSRFETITSPSAMNLWLIECYYVTLNTYMMTFLELEKSPIYSILILYSDIQIRSQIPSFCKTSLSDKIIFPDNRREIKCYNDSSNENQKDFSLNKKSLLDYSQLNFASSYLNIPDKNTFIDNLFFDRIRLEHAFNIFINNKEDLEKFSKLFDASTLKTTPLKRLNKTSLDRINDLILKESNITITDSTSSVTSNKLRFLNSSIVSKVINTNKTVQMEINFIDSDVTELVLFCFFLNQDLDKIGVSQYKYSSTSSYTNTEHYTYAFDIDLKNTEMNIGTYLINFSIMIILILFSYFKYSVTNDLEDTIGKSFFLMVAEFIFFVENIFRFYHIAQGTNNNFFKPMIMFDINARDGFIFYKENLKFFQGSTILALSFHMIYVLFSQEDLIMIKKLFKRVIIVFFLVIIVLILAITIFVNNLFGVRHKEYSSVGRTFTTLFSFIIGIENVSEEVETGTSITMYIKIFVYFIRLFVINFTLIVMILIFQRFKEKKAKLKMG